MPNVQPLIDEFRQRLSDAADDAALDQLAVDFFGRKNGKLTRVLRSLKEMSVEERREHGPVIQATHTQLQADLQAARDQLAAQHESKPDITLPGINPTFGHLHPLTQTMNEMIDIFTSMGFMVYEGPELEHDFYNFEGLNIPPSHPARDIQDTFFIKTPITPSERAHGGAGQWVMRTHTSNMQVRIMEQHQPPLRCIIPGRAFRNEATDASHEHTLYQLEGFVVGEDISIGHLFWTLQELFAQLYKTEIKVRLRPGYFPFTEPSFEPDMSCVFCAQAGCRVCKGTGWIEMGGSGMIHPNVFAAAGYPAGKYTGFAFGMGTMRLAMLKHGIPDVRMFLENDIRFLQQF